MAHQRRLHYYKLRLCGHPCPVRSYKRAKDLIAEVCELCVLDGIFIDELLKIDV